MTLRASSALSLLLLLSLTGCKKNAEDRLTAEESKEALEEASLASQASALTSETIEVTTDFTIGEGVQKAAETIADFYRSQIPCAEVSLEGPKVTVEFGALSDNCTWNGRVYGGSRSVEVGRAEEAGIQVTHTWEGFNNGVVSVSGESTVDWKFDEITRTITHDLTWSQVNGDKTAQGSGQRTQSLVDQSQGLAGGIRIDGERTWTGVGGHTWGLRIDGVEMRGVDPVPQAGTYTLTTPKEKTLSLGFERVDADTIKVTISAGGRGFSFNVKRSGAIAEA